MNCRYVVDLMERHGISLREACRRANMTQPNVSRHLRGPKADPDVVKCFEACLADRKRKGYSATVTEHTVRKSIPKPSVDNDVDWGSWRRRA